MKRFFKALALVVAISALSTSCINLNGEDDIQDLVIQEESSDSGNGQGTGSDGGSGGNNPPPGSN